MEVFEHKIILASQSPRRSQLLREAGFRFVVQPLDVDESFPEEMPAVEVAPYLAKKKARAGRQLLTEEAILLTADSVVILDGKIYNKPQDLDEAAVMLRALSGKMHRVITGVCLLSLQQERVFAGESRVFFAELSAKEIDYYLSNYETLDKAGAYAIQEWIGLCCIEKIEGSYSNIMGLPVHLVYQQLRNW